MKIGELCALVDNENIGIQPLANSIVRASQKRGYVELTIGTNVVSMGEIATGEFDRITFLVSFTKADYEAAITKASKP